MKDLLTLNMILEKMYKWSVSNRVSLNLDKTVVMTFLRKTMLVKYNYQIAGSSIRPVSYTHLDVYKRQS